MARSVTFSLFGDNRTGSAFRSASNDADRMADRVDRLGRSADDTSGSVFRLGVSMRGLGKDSGKAGGAVAALTGRTASLAAGILTVAPAALAAGAAVAAGVGAMTAAFGAAGLALGAFGLAAKSQLSGVSSASQAWTKAQDAATQYGKGSKEATEATAAYNKQLAALPPATRETAKAFVGLRQDFKAWSDGLAGDTMPVFSKGINIMRRALPALTPLVKTASKALWDFLLPMERGVKSGGFAAFIKRVNEVAKKVLPALLRSLANVGRGLGGIFEAFLPHAPKMASGIEGLTAKFAAWGKGLKSSESFKVFIDYVRRNLPALSAIFSNLVQIVGNLAMAMAPMSGISLGIIQGFTGILAALPPEVLGLLAQGFIMVTLALRILNPVIRVFNILMRLNPIGIVVLALGALALGLYTAYKRSATFRAIVNGAWAAARVVIGGAWREVIKPALDGIADLFQKAYQTWQRVWPKIKGILNEVIEFWAGPLNMAIDSVAKAFGGMGGKAQEATDKISGVGKGLDDTKGKGNSFLSWSTIFGAGIGTAIMGPLGTIVGGIVGKFWPQTKKGFSDGFAWIKNNWRRLGTDMILTQIEWGRKIVAHVKSLMSRAKQALFGGLPPLKRDWSSFWEWVRAFGIRLGELTVGAIKRFLGKVRDGFASGVSSIGRAWDKLKSVARTPINFVIGLHNSGIRPLINNLAGLVGIKTRIPVIPKFESGGTLGNPARMQPMMTNGPLAIVGEGRQAYPEYVIPTDPRFRSRAQGLWARAGQDLGAPPDRKWLAGSQSLGGEGMAFARGGSLQTLAFGGIVGDFVKGVKNFTIGNVSKGAERLLSRVLGGRVPGSGGVRDVVAGIPGWLKSTILTWVKKKVASFGGGPGIDRALAFAKAQAGKPYVWGGVGPSGYDCSGFMSALTNVIKGRRPYSRLFTTHSFGGSGGPGGFVRNARSGFTVGVTDAGVGHMAGTLGRANVESSGSAGVRVGGGARGTSNGLFTRRYGLKMDQGGMLMPGWNPPIYNGTGRPEPIVPPDHFDALASGGRGVTLNVGPVYVTETVDIDLLWQRLEFQIRAAGL